MSIEQAEQLKTELTDKWVVVDKNVPELRRFAGLTGKVKTVNMNCQALVEFHGQEDIGWYDIGTTFLTVVDKPVEKPKAEAAAPKAPAGGAKKPAAGASPLDMIRKQGAPGAKKPAAGGGSPLDQIRKQGPAGSKPAAAAADGGKKLSPLEQIRQQGAAGSKKAEEPAAEADAPAEAPVEEKKAPAAGDKKLSPLDLIRKQGPAKG
tara:strand:+ start:186974 stop:187591 length:618 start_codon:yes stop_codon:yes gene_type:complete